MKFNSDKTLRYGKITLFAGVILALIAPYFFTRSFGLISFDNTGQIGDTIGGITAPIVNLMGAVLVYFALFAQVEANRIIQRQIDEQKIDDSERKNFSSLIEIYKSIKEDLDDFTFTADETTGSIDDIFLGKIPRNFITYKGREAIEEFFKDVTRLICSDSTKIDTSKNPKYRSFINSLTILELLTKKIDSKSIAQIDKETLGALIEYLFNSRIAAFIGDEKAKCRRCGIEHEKVPTEMSSVLEKIKVNLKNAQQSH